MPKWLEIIVTWLVSHLRPKAKEEAKPIKTGDNSPVNVISNPTIQNSTIIINQNTDADSRVPQEATKSENDLSHCKWELYPETMRRWSEVSLAAPLDAKKIYHCTFQGKDVFLVETYDAGRLHGIDRNGEEIGHTDLVSTYFDISLQYWEPGALSPSQMIPIFDDVELFNVSPETQKKLRKLHKHVRSTATSPTLL